MKSMSLRVLLAALGAIGAPVMAADFDASRPLICATVEARDCVAEETCVSGTPGKIGAPSFVRIDFERKVIVGPQRATPILVMEQGVDQLLFQGTELGYGWVFALDQTQGRFSASLTNREGAFVLFGSCVPL